MNWAIAAPIIGSVFVMLAVQTSFWLYKFGKVEQKVSDQNGRIDRLERVQDETRSGG